jgi:hypothetical protein
MVRHNDMEKLEEKILSLKNKHSKIWYLGDGVYSMYGDLCKLAELNTLLNKHEQLWAYLDDAHGMSYYGKNGSGYVCSQTTIHPKMILTTSLNKAFAAGGGALIFNDAALGKKVRTCGSPFITSGPLQPANLGAGIASALIHLSDEIYDLQNNLHDKIQFTKDLLLNADLPLISESGAAIFFIGVSVPKLGYRIVEKMLERGFFVNLGIFPAVPIKNTGIRFTITALHTYKQINTMVSALKEEFENALKQENISLEEIYKAFKKELPAEKKAAQLANTVVTQVLQLRTEIFDSIEDIEKEMWNQMYTGKGAFDWEGLQLLEAVFSNNNKKEDNWIFKYIIVKDNNNNPVAATFATTALWKDDMLSPAETSKKIEELRKSDPYYLVSKVTATGTLITEGEHVFVDKKNTHWQQALLQLLEVLDKVQQLEKSNALVLRDFINPEKDLSDVITGNGFFKNQMPDTHIATTHNWNSDESFYQTLDRKNKKNFKADIKKFYSLFTFSKIESPTEKDILNWYKMYTAVREKNLDINTFPLPFKFFSQAAKSKNWDITTLCLKETGETVSVVFAYKSEAAYFPTVIGMNYQYLSSHKIYKQTLFRLLQRANELGCKKTHMGFGASLEKRKLNCQPVEAFSFVNLIDSYNTEFITNYKAVAS